jgi:NADH:ubiquinone oxidoreductase subunit F (NADH-binding)
MTDRPLTQNIRADGTPTFIKDYEGMGGYSGLRKALKEMSPESCHYEVKNSRQRGH